jgi:tyrosinase
VLVGGDSGFMADPNFAALDPIFWAHHANIDRLWESWLARGGGRANPTANSAWMNTDFTFFDENGTQVTMKGSQVLQTAAQLGYRYDALEAPQVPVPTPESPEVPEATPATLVTVSKKTSLGDKTSVSVKLPKTAFPSPGLESAGGGKSFTLHVEGLQSDKSSGGFWEVYLNLPKGAAASHDSPHFIGTVAFFGRKHAHNPSAPSSQDFDITGVVNKLRREGKLKDGKLDVQFVRRTMGGGKSKVEGAPRFDKLRVEAQ